MFYKLDLIVYGTKRFVFVIVSFERLFLFIWCKENFMHHELRKRFITHEYMLNSLMSLMFFDNLMLSRFLISFCIWGISLIDDVEFAALHALLDYVRWHLVSAVLSVECIREQFRENHALVFSIWTLTEMFRNNCN